MSARNSYFVNKIARATATLFKKAHTPKLLCKQKSTRNSYFVNKIARATATLFKKAHTPKLLCKQKSTRNSFFVNNIFNDCFLACLNFLQLSIYLDRFLDNYAVPEFRFSKCFPQQYFS
jgi:hypothetical protein